MKRLTRLAATGMLVALTGCAGTGLRGIRTDDLARALASMPSAAGRIDRASDFRIQVLISEVVPSASGRPTLRRHGYRVDAEYFYPASSIKLCAAVAGLQVLDELGRAHGVADLIEALAEIGPLFPGDPVQRSDAIEVGGGVAGGVGSGAVPRPITFGREIRKLALVSDNTAFNRLFDLVGHAALNQRMRALGLESVAVQHRLSETRSIPVPRATAPVVLRPPGLAPIHIPGRTSDWVRANPGPGLHVGTAFLRGDERVPEPMDFAHRNRISLEDLQALLLKVVRPDVDDGRPALRLPESGRTMLVDAMTRYPRESEDPVYPADAYPDAYAKFLLPGVRRVFPETAPGRRVEITGKIGRAYGFSVENAYLRNPVNGRAVLVSAVIYTNADGVLNDDRYEYTEVADPFLADLGELVARRWLTDEP